MRAFKNPAAQQAHTGFTSGEKKKLFFMGLSLLVVLGMIGYAFLKSREDQRPAELPREEPMAESVALPPLDLAAIEATVRDGSAEARVLLEGAALDRMLEHTRRLTPASYEALGARELDDEARAELLANPSAHRGDAVLVRGWLKELHTRRRSPSAPEEHHGRIVGEDGEVTYFVTNEAPARLLPDVDYVRLDGRFLKVFSEEDPEAPGTWREGPLVVGTTLEHSWQELPELAELDTLFLLQAIEHDHIETSADGAPRVVSTGHPFDAMWHTMAWARDAAASVDWDAAPELDPAAIWKLKEEPGEYVGQPFRFPVCRLQGVRVRRAPENPARLEEYTEGWLGNNTWSNVVHFWSPVADRDLYLRDYVNARGVFVRNFAYDSAQRGVQIAPLFVVTSIESFVPETDPLFRNMAVGIAGASIALTVLFVLLVRRDRKRAAANQAAQTERRRARRKAGKLPTPGV